MSDDLIQRLRDAAALPTGLHAEAADEIERLRDALGRIVTEVSDELPGEAPPTGIQSLAHTVAVIATTALAPNAQAQASREAASRGAPGWAAQHQETDDGN